MYKLNSPVVLRRLENSLLLPDMMEYMSLLISPQGFPLFGDGLCWDVLEGSAFRTPVMEEGLRKAASRIDGFLVAEQPEPKPKSHQ